MTHTPPRWVANERDRGWTVSGPDGAASAFHRSLPGYAPTPLVELPALAAELGVGRVVAKDESTRLGLPAFKALGASWAVQRALATAAPDAAVVTATDGNHGRAVARFSRAAGRAARIYIPKGGIHPLAVQAIADEGAQLVEVEGDYDEAVAAAARSAEDTGDVLVQDTSWDGYEQIPGWIVEGYDTLFTELDEQLGAFDLLVVPTGVGSLLQAAVTHYRSGGRTGTALVAVEPTAAACITASLEAGAAVSVDTVPTIMSGLNCGTPTSIGWPIIRDGLDASVAVTDADAFDDAHALAALGLPAGPCGAASLSGARQAVATTERRAHLGLDADSTVVLLITEGTDANPLPDVRPGG